MTDPSHVVRWLTPCVIISLVWPVMTSAISSNQKVSRGIDTGEEFNAVLRGLEKAIYFFKEDYSSINVDGLFGIRMAQGSLVQSLDWCSKQETTKCPTHIYRRLRQLNRTIDLVAEKALPYIESQDPTYYKNFIKMIDAPYLIEASLDSLGDAIADPGTHDDYNQTQGNRCMSSLMGGWEEDGKTVPVCTVASGCVATMSDVTGCNYTITHHLLFFIVAEKNGCLEKIDRQLKDQGAGSTKETERRLCGHIYSEMEREVRLAGGQDVADWKQDLFLEQGLLCGIIGFAEFFNSDWTQTIMKWQSPYGCFGLTSSQRDFVKQHRLMNSMATEAEAIKEQSNPGEQHQGWTGRKLMREQLMNGDCLSHKTGLGIGMLGAIQKHLLMTA